MSELFDGSNDSGNLANSLQRLIDCLGNFLKQVV